MPNDFGGLRVLSLESRRAKEMGQLISNNGGAPIIAPSTREIPEGPNEDELKFAAALQQDKFGVVIFLTGVGTRHLANAIQSVCPKEMLAAALRRTKVVARGPKPVAVLREFGIQPSLTVPEPNTWREVVQTLDQNSDKVPLRGQLVAIQEYGVPSAELYAALKERGAKVFPVHVYKWEPPEDTAPLRNAISALSRAEIDVVMFTSSVQIHHLLQFADEMNLRESLMTGLGRAVVVSIGPTTSATLRDMGIEVDMEPSRPKMGYMVKEAAEQSKQLLSNKRPSSG